MPATVSKESILAGVGRQRLHHTARAVAAGLRERAILIEDLDEMIRTRRAGIVNGHDLIEMRGRIGGKRKGRLRRYAVSAPAHVRNDDLVADTVHPGEGSRA
jgi:hypothetical protein